MMDYDRDALRALTFADNVEWLRSFGCSVEEHDGMTLIHHPQLTEYEAWLFTEATPVALGRLRRIVSGEIDDARAVYVDDDAATDEVHAILAGVPQYGKNVTVAAPVPARNWSSPFELQRAAPEEWETWAAMYSRGFGRQSRADAERERWRLSFLSGRVDHWFFLRGGERIGVCQTTLGAVHGIYSFTLLPEERGVRSALLALRALLAYIARQPSRWIYFEVLERSPLARTRVQAVLGLRSIRNLTGYTPAVAREE